MPPDAELFAFEADFVDTFRCVPMAVRFKLDRVGVKLSLRQWSRMTREDREGLLVAPCGTADEVSAYRETLCALIVRRADEMPRMLAEPPCGSWERPDVPDAVVRQAAEARVPAPAAEAWAKLPQLRRFVLVKLARDNHDNVNFAPAMREFGLA
jgi:hypothetical protein